MACINSSLHHLSPCAAPATFLEASTSPSPPRPFLPIYPFLPFQSFFCRVLNKNIFTINSRDLFVISNRGVNHDHQNHASSQFVYFVVSCDPAYFRVPLVFLLCVLQAKNYFRMLNPRETPLAAASLCDRFFSYPLHSDSLALLEDVSSNQILHIHKIIQKLSMEERC